VLAEIAVGAVAFISTNLDDVFLLAAFFADARMRTRAIVLGQYLGIAALVIASALVALLALAIPAAWVSLLGFVPLALGLRVLWSLRGGARRADDAREPRPPIAGPGSQVLTVAGVTVASGGDNLGVYIPLFSIDPAAVAIHAVTFFVLTGVLCAVARVVVRNRFLAAILKRHAPLILALMLIGLGVWLLWGARELVTA
jgi:cadmium resistance protein CadD (predicted permease)